MRSGIAVERPIRNMGQADGVKSRAARLLGLKHYQSLDQRMKRLNVTLD